MMRKFQSGRCHLAFVSRQPDVALECIRSNKRPPQEAKFLGMVTLEDILEKLIQDDIVDETDGRGHTIYVADNNKRKNKKYKETIALWNGYDLKTSATDVLTVFIENV